MKKGNVYIFGEPRSGTTWLAKIFDSHPDRLLRHEPDTVNPTLEFPFIMPSNEIGQHLDQARRYLHERAQDRQLRCVSNTPYFPKNYRNSITDKVRKAMIFAFRALDLASRGKLDRNIRVPDMVSKKSKLISVVKSVDSCGRLPLFAKACPDDKFVFILRHPCGVVASKFRGRELGKMDPAITFRKLLDLDSAKKFQLTEDQLRGWSTLEADAWQWLLIHDFIFEIARNLPNVHIVKYDDLCRSPIPKSKAVFEWAGLAWNEQTEAYINACISIDPAARVGFYSTVQNPQQAANKWRTQLSEDDVATIMAICQKGEAGRLFESTAIIHT